MLVFRIRTGYHASLTNKHGIPFRQFLQREDLFPFEVGGCGLGFVNFRHWAGQHVLVDQQEVGVFAFFDAASLLLNEHLLGAVDSQGGERLLAGEAFFRPPGLGLLGLINTRDYNLHDAERIVRSTAKRGEVGVRG